MMDTQELVEGGGGGGSVQIHYLSKCTGGTMYNYEYNF